MNADTVIAVEGLSKRYLIGHQLRHDTLRDAMVQGVRGLVSRVRRHDAGGRADREEFWALRDVAFEVRRGEVLGIIGRNGAGKSTLLKILSRITEPTRGRVALRGRVASLLEVGTGFHPELSGRENIFLNGAILGMSREEIRRKFDEIVAFAEVEQFLDTPVKRYSSGMYVRLAFAVAAHLEPEILIVDEVLSVGDVAFQRKCVGKLQDVAGTSGRTVLFVSHNLPVVRRLCPRALLLDRGRIAAAGAAAEVLNTYTHAIDELPAARMPAPTPDQEAKAYVSAAWLEKPDGKPLVVARVGEPWRLRVHFVAGRSLRDFVIALGVTTGEGTGLQTVWSPAINLDPGRYEAIFLQDYVALAADSYDLVLGLSEGGKSIQQFPALRLEVTGEDPLVACAATSGYGLVINSMKTTVRPLDQAGKAG